MPLCQGGWESATEHQKTSWDITTAQCACYCEGSLGISNLFVRGFPCGSMLRLANATPNTGRAILHGGSRFWERSGCSIPPAAPPQQRVLVSSWATADFHQAGCKATQWLKYPHSPFCSNHPSPFCFPQNVEKAAVHVVEVSGFLCIQRKGKLFQRKGLDVERP